MVISLKSRVSRELLSNILSGVGVDERVHCVHQAFNLWLSPRCVVLRQNLQGICAGTRQQQRRGPRRSGTSNFTQPLYLNFRQKRSEREEGVCDYEMNAHIYIYILFFSKSYTTRTHTLMCVFTFKKKTCFFCPYPIPRIFHSCCFFFFVFSLLFEMTILFFRQRWTVRCE